MQKEQGHKYIGRKSKKKFEVRNYYSHGLNGAIADNWWLRLQSKKKYGAEKIKGACNHVAHIGATVMEYKQGLRN
jgi:hypothetical protein